MLRIIKSGNAEHVVCFVNIQKYVFKKWRQKDGKNSTGFS